MSIERKANIVLQEARKLSGKVGTWADFSARMFDGFHGIVATTFPDEMERQAFFDSAQYSEIRGLLLDLMKKHGVVNGSKVTDKSGKFVVRVPKTVHQNLESEAKLEGVSLNQLAVSKLSIPLQDRAEKEQAKRLVIMAFNTIHEGYSPDWVIVEPHRNLQFLEKCKAMGLGYLSPFWLNHLLMNVRKDPKYRGQLNRSTKRTGFSDYDDCAFAAEIAIRTLQRTRGVTLDQTLCDPVLLTQFDALAKRYVLGQTELKLRCAALNLRKTHRLQPTGITPEGHELVTVGPVRNISLSSISHLAGTYVFYDLTRPLFAGETDNLRKRIEMHIDAGLPEWIKAAEDEAIVLKILTLPSVKRDERLTWLGSFINRERPVLNYQKIA